MGDMDDLSIILHITACKHSSIMFINSGTPIERFEEIILL